MHQLTEPVLGIDTGGTSIKCGIVYPDGKISHRNSYPTRQLVSESGTEDFLTPPIAQYLDQFPFLRCVGIGLPGYLSANRNTILALPNIPGKYPLPLKDRLSGRFPGIGIQLENDANCAALGEYVFGAIPGKDCLLVTMGTGIGSGAIIHGNIFRGSGGNGMELGHITDGNGNDLEFRIGKRGIINYRQSLKGITVTPEPHSFTAILDAARMGVPEALEVFRYVAQELALALQHALMLLDLDTIFIGGGLSVAFDLICPELTRLLRQTLAPYYSERLLLRRASLGNDAGMLGAALLHSIRMPGTDTQ